MYECADDDDDADEIIGSLTSQLTQLPQPVVALYTAVKSHVVRLVNSALIFMCLSACFSCLLKSCPSEAHRASLGTFWDCRHGRKSLGDEFPRIWSGDANANCPQIFKKYRSEFTKTPFQASEKFMFPL